METRLVKINNMEDCKKDMEEAGELIKAGELVAFPTETVYGLGMDYFLMRQRRSMQRKEDLLIIH